jgi:CheY-like chemotaxis protein
VSGDELAMKQNPYMILVIEDDHDVAELIACFLAGAKLRPVIASNGLAGLQQARSLMPSLILCDSCMPGLDGVEVISRLRADAATAGIPIILMSGYDAARFDGAGANTFLQKPFLAAELLGAVQSCVTQRPVSITHESSRKASLANQELCSEEQAACSDRFTGQAICLSKQMQPI